MTAYSCFQEKQQNSTKCNASETLSGALPCLLGEKRLISLMERADRGEALVIAFLGGSITQGSVATGKENTYAYRVYEWWRKSFPSATFTYVNGGIGGTDSYFGASRAKSDVLSAMPDLVVVDFSVNDDGNPYAMETYEGTMRQLLSWKSEPSVLALCNVFYDTGFTVEDVHKVVCSHYGVPVVSIKDTVYARMKAGEFTRADITPDGLHPNDRGHELVAGEIIKVLENYREAAVAGRSVASGEAVASGEMVACGRAVASAGNVLPEPVTENAYEGAIRLTSRDIAPQLSGFVADTREKVNFLDHFANGWIGAKAGDKLTCELTGSCMGIQYRKTVKKPAAVAMAVIDGDRDNPVVLDGNFDEDWGDCLYIEKVVHHGEWKVHSVEITIVTEGNKGVTPFYLMSFIVA